VPKRRCDARLGVISQARSLLPISRKTTWNAATDTPARPDYCAVVASIRTGCRPTADIEIGHLSATLGHLANIATRRQRTLHFDPKTEQFIGDDEASALLSRTCREGGHWAIPKGV
jgi:hypothetical protein